MIRYWQCEIVKLSDTYIVLQKGLAQDSFMLFGGFETAKYTE